MNLHLPCPALPYRGDSCEEARVAETVGMGFGWNAMHNQQIRGMKSFVFNKPAIGKKVARAS